MSKILRDRLKDGIIVFDVDGVLATYEFGDCCHTTPEWGEEVFKSVDDNPYCTVNPIPVLQDYIKQLSSDKVYVCSVADGHERECKAAFVTKHYAIDEQQILFVNSKKEKAEVLSRIKRENPGVQIAIVDDTVKTLDNIWLEDSSILTVHVTSFFD